MNWWKNLAETEVMNFFAEMEVQLMRRRLLKRRGIDEKNIAEMEAGSMKNTAEMEAELVRRIMLKWRWDWWKAYCWNGSWIGEIYCWNESWLMKFFWLKWMRDLRKILVNESGIFYKINSLYCAELSAPNCPTPNCPNTVKCNVTCANMIYYKSQR